MVADQLCGGWLVQDAGTLDHPLQVRVDAPENLAFCVQPRDQLRLRAARRLRGCELLAQLCRCCRRRRQLRVLRGDLGFRVELCCGKTTDLRAHELTIMLEGAASPRI